MVGSLPHPYQWYEWIMGGSLGAAVGRGEAGRSEGRLIAGGRLQIWSVRRRPSLLPPPFFRRVSGATLRKIEPISIAKNRSGSNGERMRFFAMNSQESGA